MKNRKTMITIGIIILAIVVVISIILILNNQNQKKIEQTVKDFAMAINEKNYEAMYEKIANINMSKENFISRNKNIYEGIDVANLCIEVKEIQKQGQEYKVNYHQKMITSAGEIEFDNSVNVVKDKEYKLKWSSNFIFPQLEDNQKVRISTLKAKRGDILDRNDEKLATDGTILSAGIVPGKLGENKEENIAKIAELTGVSEDYINQQLQASWVKDDTFVPIKKLTKNNEDLKESLLSVQGILMNEEKARIYPLGKEAGHLIGYVQTINAEELEEKQEQGYGTTSIIGKSGLERAYEEILRGIDGKEIYIIDEKGNRVSDIKKQNKKDGKDVKLTIDSNLQSNVYKQMSEEDKGLFVIMQPKTGELLALVSNPTFDSNDFVVGMTNEQWQELNNDERKPLYNRFIQKYCPGSTFKPITGAIGLTTGKINPNDDYGYNGTSWQKDNTWGNYKITTLTEYNKPKNLVNAMMYSDNIYFAQSALKIGADSFAENLNKLGFNENLEFPLTLSKSQYAVQNGNNIEGETKLADSGYGQGSILVNPIHMAAIYSAFANNGNMVKPYIEYKEDEKVNIWKENVFSEETSNIVKDTMIQVVENKEGSANDMKIEGLTIAGKTGTAELKTSNEDTQSGTLGWFNCFTTDETNGNNLLIISMIENKQENQDGGSHYLIQKIKNILQ